MRIVLLTAIVALFNLPALAQAQQDDSILSDAYIVSQEYVEAKVVSVNLRDRKLTVRGEKRGQTRVFTVAEGARISIKGRDARLRDIRRGDTVLVALQPKAEEVVISRVRVPQTPVDLTARRAAPVQTEVAPAMLPKTASPLPALLVAGLLALFGAAATRTLRRSR